MCSDAMAKQADRNHSSHAGCVYVHLEDLIVTSAGQHIQELKNV